jgi:DNA helicase II / ATP-dependent DNA helicase PcrA
MLELRSEFLKLDDRQKQAVEREDNTAVLAGSGSGKTATLVLKVAHLLTEILPPFTGLGCITYNNDAVREIKKRLMELGIYQGRRLFLGTVHSFCLNCILRPYAGLVIPRFAHGIFVAGAKHADMLLDRALSRSGVTEKVSYYWPRLTCLRRKIICAEDTSGYEATDFSVLAEYEQYLERDKLVDFESMVGLSVTILRDHPWIGDLLVSRFPWLIVDEYQDLGGPLHQIVSTMVDYGAKIFAVGDPDQTIYDFTGADPKYLLELCRRTDFNCIRLKFNYRSGRKLIDASQAALCPEEPRNYDPHPERIDQGEVFFIKANDQLEDHAAKAVNAVQRAIQDGIASEEIAILYSRRDLLLDEIRTELDQANIPYSAERDSKYPSAPVIRWLQDAAAWAVSGQIISDHFFEDVLRYYRSLLIDAGDIESHTVPLQARLRLYDALSDTIAEDMPLRSWLAEILRKLRLEELLGKSESHVDDQEALNQLVSTSRTGGSLDVARLVDFASDGRVRGKVVLTTFHSSKGRQFDWVVIPGLVEGILPNWSWNRASRKYLEPSTKKLAEARRLFYVGFTRARKAVCLVYSKSYINKGQAVSLGVSRFAKEISTRLRPA